MTPLISIDEIVIDQLRSKAPCSLDDLVKSLPSLSWGQVFSAVDRMSRNRRLWLSQVGFSSYVVIPYPQLETPKFDVSPDGNIHHNLFS
jgi:hypothetical protein